jgi:hypothetical protein
MTKEAQTHPVANAGAVFMVLGLGYILVCSVVWPHKVGGSLGFIGFILLLLLAIIAGSVWQQRRTWYVKAELTFVRWAVATGLVGGGLMLLAIRFCFS